MLTPAVVLLAALCLVNLALTLGVVRRLRVHTELLSVRSEHAVPMPILAPGKSIEYFESKTIEGEAVSRDVLRDGTLIGFFSPGCWACKDQLPGFVGYATSRKRSKRPLGIVVASDGGDDLIAALGSDTRVILEPPGGPVARAFGVIGFPAFCRLSPDGTILASSHDLKVVADVSKE
jgi:hypothetical protein